MIPEQHSDRLEAANLRLCVSPPAEHLFDFRDVHLLVTNFLTRKFLKRNATAFAQIKQTLIEVDASALVHEQLLHYIVDGFMVSPRELPDAERDARTKRGYLFTGLCGMN